MNFNPSKCEFLKVTKKLALHFNYYINNKLIKKVQPVKYLGIIIDSHMTTLMLCHTKQIPHWHSFDETQTPVPPILNQSYSIYLMSDLLLNIHLPCRNPPRNCKPPDKLSYQGGRRCSDWTIRYIQSYSIIIGILVWYVIICINRVYCICILYHYWIDFILFLTACCLVCLRVLHTLI